VRLHILSDLHLEFAPFTPPRVEADVVLLVGDTNLGCTGIDFATQAFAGRPVLYVAGNHEYYGGSLPALTEQMREHAGGTNVRFLENDVVVLNNVRFVGCTLWTDFELHGPERADEARRAARASLNDYHQIHDSTTGRELEPDDTAALHAHSREWLLRTLRTSFGGPTVVITHHGPSIRTCAPQYHHEPLAAAFTSDLTDLMGQERVALWVFGHTHYCTDFSVRGTRVVSNQRGYPGEPTGGFDPGLVLRVGADGAQGAGDGNVA
jgi:predicted phosphohydrolase